MNKNDKQKDHPEITDIKHICDISPDTKDTEGVCEKVSHHDRSNKKTSNKNPKKNKT
ncbi:hypothetical protein [Legionella brunensis]|uniref:Uncharacterized protein n=1 Tax=Legionella brunensis TaxID=29422 RepID=A0A0W0SKZ2_9GAMM|nr:hypothetical protein [Legionella brunensis]KTC84082.1 hypothetical protein Lbru_1443 [Legionella brunensis]